MSAMKSALIAILILTTSSPSRAQTFLLPQSLSLTQSTTAMTVNTFDADAVPDIIVSLSTGGLQMLLNTGGGNFGTTVTVSATISADFLDSVDLDGDGDIDLVAATKGSGTSGVGSFVHVFLNSGSGSFTLAATIIPNDNIWQFDLGDIDGDGRIDFVLVLRYAQACDIFLNTGSTGVGLFPATRSERVVTGSQAFAAAVGDFDQDGNNDLVVSVNNGSGVDGLQIRKNMGAPVRFPSTGVLTNVPTVGLPQRILVTDLDGNGHPDIASANDGTSALNSLAVLLNNPSTPFSFFVQLQGLHANQFCRDIAAADLDLDGDLDLVTANQTNNQPTATIFLNNGSGCFANTACNPSAAVLAGLAGSAGSNNPAAVAAVDCDANGSPDLLFASTLQPLIHLHLSSTPALGTYPGGGDDLVISSAAFPTTQLVPLTGGPLHDIKQVFPGDVLQIRISSPMGSKDSLPFVVVGQLATTGMARGTAFGAPDAWIDPALTPSPVLIPAGVSFGGFQFLPAFGVTVASTYPGGAFFAGQSLFVQAFSISPNVTNGNMFFTSTDAHEFRLM